MEAYEQITLDQWMQWKEDIRRKLEETAGNFVHIGYRLKQIRDSGMYDGAADVFGFAAREFGLGKSTVSRFIAINEKYSEGGNSLELKEEFRGFSSSKLSEMLTLPDSEIQLITERTTIREIRELKGFNSQPPEEEGREAEAGRTPLEGCLIDFFRTRKGMLNDVMQRLGEEPMGYKEAAKLMVPSGQASHRKGIVFLFLYDWSTGAKYKLMTEPEPVAMGWKELLDIVRGIYGGCCQPDVWGDFYREQDTGKGQTENAAPARPDQGKVAVATSQQDGMEETEKGQEDTGAGTASPEPAAQKTGDVAEKPVEATEEACQETEGMLPGQMEITDYPEAAHARSDQGKGAVATSQQGNTPEPERGQGGAGTEELPPQGKAEDESGGPVGPTTEGSPAEGPQKAAGAEGQKEDAGNGPGLEEGELAWMDMERHLAYLKQWAVVWNYEDVPSDILLRAYHTSIDMAASIERIMDAKGVKNG